MTFLILAHRNPEQLQLLVNYLLENDCCVLVHIDKKSRRLFRDFLVRNADRKGLACYSEFRVYWGSFNQIEATFFLLKKALSMFAADYFVLLSGQDLLIKPIAELKHFLSQQQGRSFIEYYPLPAFDKMEGRGGLDRVQLFWFTNFSPAAGVFFNKLNVILHFFQRRLGLSKAWKVPLFAGPNWFVLHSDEVQAVLKIIGSDPDLYAQFRHTRLADEVIMQTLLMAAGREKRLVNNALRYVDWSSGPEFPRTLRIGDAGAILGSSAFFARKFDDKTDKEIISLIYSRIEA